MLSIDEFVVCLGIFDGYMGMHFDEFQVLHGVLLCRLETFDRKNVAGVSPELELCVK